MSGGVIIDRNGDIDLSAIVGTLWSRRGWLLSGMLLGGAAFATAAFLMTPMFRATTVLVDATSDRSSVGSLGSALGQLGGLASLAGINVGSSGSKIEESLAVLRSREFTEAFIRDTGLMPEVLYEKWDAGATRWKGAENRWPKLNDAYKVFDKRIRSVNRDSRTGLVTLQIVWRDPEKAASWANELVLRLNAEMRERAIASSNASVGYLEKEMAATSGVETRQAISRLIEAQINQRMLANVTEEYALRVVDRALPPDPRDKVSPRRAVLIALGMILGFLVCALAVLTGSLSASRKAVRTHL